MTDAHRITLPDSMMLIGSTQLALWKGFNASQAVLAPLIAEELRTVACIHKQSLTSIVIGTGVPYEQTVVADSLDRNIDLYMRIRAFSILPPSLLLQRMTASGSLFKMPSTSLRSCLA